MGQHSLETTSPPEPLKKKNPEPQSSCAFCPTRRGCTLSGPPAPRGLGGPVPSASVPLAPSPACPLAGRCQARQGGGGARRCPQPGRGRTESGRAERRGEERGGGSGGEGRGGECPAGNASGAGPWSRPVAVSVGMALHLVTDFDLRKDALPWLRAQRAAWTGAGARGSCAGAGGARPGWRTAGGGRRSGKAESFNLGAPRLGRDGGYRADSRGRGLFGGPAACGPRQPVKVRAEGAHFPPWSPGPASLTPGHWVEVGGAAPGQGRGWATFLFPASPPAAGLLVGRSSSALVERPGVLGTFSIISPGRAGGAAAETPLPAPRTAARGRGSFLSRHSRITCQGKKVPRPRRASERTGGPWKFLGYEKEKNRGHQGNYTNT